MSIAHPATLFSVGTEALTPASEVYNLANAIEDTWTMTVAAAKEEPYRYQGLLATFDPSTNKATLSPRTNSDSTGLHTSFFQDENQVWTVMHEQYVPAIIHGLYPKGFLRTRSLYPAAVAGRRRVIVDECIRNRDDDFDSIRVIGDREDPRGMTNDVCRTVIDGMRLRPAPVRRAEQKPRQPVTERVLHAVGTAAAWLWNPVSKR